MNTQMNGTQKITPYLWFDHEAEEAATYYVSLFSSIGAPSGVGHISRYGEATEEISGIAAGTAMTVDFELGGCKFITLNGGPQFSFTPSVSFFVACDTAEEVDALYAKLSEGGRTLMPLDAYPFSERYAWVNDRYGVSWQLIKGAMGDKITPSLLFVAEQNGRAEEAMNLYVSLFEDSAVGEIMRHGAEHGPELEGTVAFATFKLAGQPFVVQDGGPNHEFTFSEATSLFVQCADQEEVDHFWYKLIADGGEESMCGWLKDRFGVSWQVVPTALMEMLSDEDAEKAERVTRAMLQMKKLDIGALQQAYAGGGA